MKNSFLYLLMFISIIFFSTLKVNAQTTVALEAVAEVIESLSANEGVTLNFGRFSPEATGGTIIISTEGARTKTGTLAFGVGDYNQAVFQITGQPTYNLKMTGPTGPTVLTLVGDNKTMAISDWTIAPVFGANGVVIPASGTLDVKVGATLTVGTIEANPAGVYKGEYELSFSYE